MKKVSVEEFKKFKIRLRNFIADYSETFYNRFLMESIHNPKFMKEVNNIMDYVDQDLNANEIEDLFYMLRTKGEQEFINADKCEDEIEKINDKLSGQAYFSIIEALNESSTFSEKIIKSIKDKYGSDYLKTIEKIDRAFLSDDGKKMLIEADNTDLPNDEEMKKYIVLKEWQDKQRNYSMKRIRPFYDEEREYIGEDEQNIVRLQEKTLTKRAMQDLDTIDLVKIEEIVKFCEVGLDDEIKEKFGGKAYGLAKLRAQGIDTPKTYCIATNKNIDNLDFSCLDSNKKYAVRSSADVEDGDKNSFAGMFDSFLNVSKEDINNTVINVKKSVNNSRVNKYVEMNKLKCPSMGVVIQEYVEPEISGVWIGENKDSGLLEWVEGNGEKLVSGRTNPNREKWNNGKTDVDVVLQTNGKKIGEQLLNVQGKLSTDKTDIADMEWCVLDGKLFLLQYRPVTKKLNLDQLNNNDNNNEIFRGTPASSGEVVGSAKYVRKIDELKEWNDGDILMAWFTDPDWMELMSKSSGLVTAVGGLLCHSAIIARELGIPCVIGIGGDSMKKIWNENSIYINGNTGEVCTERVYEKNKKKYNGKGGEER